MLDRGRDRSKIAELLADERCSQSVLVFSQLQMSEGRQAHRWQRKETERPARPQDGRTGNARSNAHC